MVLNLPLWQRACTPIAGTFGTADGVGCCSELAVTTCIHTLQQPGRPFRQGVLHAV